jgi:hypothetical protein
MHSVLHWAQHLVIQSEIHLGCSMVPKKVMQTVIQMVLH